MGKMKELFMKTHYPHEIHDLDREYLIDDLIKREQEYLEYLKLQQELNQTKIEVTDGRETRIEIHSEKEISHREVESLGFGF